MPSTYSTNLGLELLATGEKSGVWGDIVNSNLGTLLEQAVSGFVGVTMSDVGDTTITMPDGATGVARNMILQTMGTLTAERNLIVPAKKKLYFIYNSCNYPVTVKCSGGTGESIPVGKKVVVFCDGTDIELATNYMFGDISGNATTVTNGLYSTTSYSDPSWLTALNATKLTGTIASDRLPVVPTTKGGTGADNVSSARANLNVPTRTGGDASGTWPINITGNAVYATSAGFATTAAAATTAGTSGSFTVYLRAYNDGPGLTNSAAYWRKNNNVVTLFIPSLQASSTETTLLVDGLPAGLLPAYNFDAVCYGRISGLWAVIIASFYANLDYIVLTQPDGNAFPASTGHAILPTTFTYITA